MKDKTNQQQTFSIKFNISNSSYSRIKHGYEKTENKDLAIHMAEKWGNTPIFYIKERWQDKYLKWWPSMGKPRKGAK